MLQTRINPSRVQQQPSKSPLKTTTECQNTTLDQSKIVERDPETKPTKDKTRQLALPLRVLLIGLGTVFLVLGLLGVLLPVLPTTPFALLAAACYARSSESLYQRLLANRWLGPSIMHWRATRSVPRKAKITAVSLVIISFTFSIVWATDNPWIRAILGLVGLALTGFLLSIRTTESLRDEEEES